MRKQAELSRKSVSFAKMFVAVASASPGATSVPCTEKTATTPVTILSKYKAPAILAVKRGDPSAIRSVENAELMRVFAFLTYRCEDLCLRDAGRAMCTPE